MFTLKILYSVTSVQNVKKSMEKRNNNLVVKALWGHDVRTAAWL